MPEPASSRTLSGICDQTRAFTQSRAALIRHLEGNFPQINLQFHFRKNKTKLHKMKLILSLEPAFSFFKINRNVKCCGDINIIMMHANV